MFTLNINQKNIFEEITKGHLKYVFISGTAGTGKSVLLRSLANFYSNQCKVVALSAIAARNVNGQTIHSAFNINFENKCTKLPTFDKKILIIDEVSMISDKLLDRIDKVLRILKRNNLPFGNVTVICFGDLYQLEPININANIHLNFINSDDDKDVPEVFPRLDLTVYKANVWKYFKYRELKKNMRQKDDLIFVENLKKLRIGDNSIIDYFNTFHNEKISLDMMKESLTLVPTNKEALKINKLIFSEISENKQIFKCNIDEKFIKILSVAEYSDFKKKFKTIWNNPSDEKLKQVISQIKSSTNDSYNLDVILSKLCKLSKVEEIKDLMYTIEKISEYEKINNFSYNYNQKENIFCENAICENTRLMFTVNNYCSASEFSGEDSFFNGETCVVVECSNDKIVVQKNGGEENEKLILPKIKLYFKNFSNNVNNYYEICGYPVKYAWACTVHKMQGATIDNLIIKNTKMFANGQLYVAFSRVRKAKNLTIGNKISPQSLKTNPEIDEEYERLKNLEVACYKKN